LGQASFGSFIAKGKSGAIFHSPWFFYVVSLVLFPGLPPRSGCGHGAVISTGYLHRKAIAL
jgi:hypothetical protein